MKVKQYKKSIKSRLEYIYLNYAKTENISLTEFVDEINKSYYKYDNYLFPWDLKDIYLDFFKNLENGYDIIDIGAGTGFSHKLINEINYSFNKYYFIEPSTNMSDRFVNKNISNTIIINDYIENIWNIIKENKNRKIFIMNAALHHIIDLDLFSKNLINVMNVNDFLFIPHEPNNEFNSNFYSKLLNISNPKKLFKNILKNIYKHILTENQILFLKKVFKKTIHSDETLIDTLELALNDLINKNIVKSGFQKNMIYAITDYGVANNWRNIYIPDEWNEGFYTIATIPGILNLKLEYQKTYSYNYLETYPLFKKEQQFDRKFRKIFPKSGSILCLALIKQ